MSTEKKSSKEILKKCMSVEYCGGTRFDYLDEDEKPLIYKAMKLYAETKCAERKRRQINYRKNKGI